MTHAYTNPAHYLACRIRLDEAVVVDPGYGADKIKAKRVCEPLFEVDAEAL